MSGRNNLYPIFLKLHELNTLIVGGGNVGLEKISFLLKSSPDAQVTMVSPEFKPQIMELAKDHPSVTLLKREFISEDLSGKDLLVLATENEQLNFLIRSEAKSRGILTNVADTPDLCDFYLGSIVTKGDLKVAISTNGKSPTFAKRFRELLEGILPDEVPDLLDNLKIVRDNLKGDFDSKVKALNQITANLVSSDNSKVEERENSK